MLKIVKKTPTEQSKREYNFEPRISGVDIKNNATINLKVLYA